MSLDCMVWLTGATVLGFVFGHWLGARWGIDHNCIVYLNIFPPDWLVHLQPEPEFTSTGWDIVISDIIEKAPRCIAACDRYPWQIPVPKELITPNK